MDPKRKNINAFLLTKNRIFKTLIEYTRYYEGMLNANWLLLTIVIFMRQNGQIVIIIVITYYKTTIL